MVSPDVRDIVKTEKCMSGKYMCAYSTYTYICMHAQTHTHIYIYSRSGKIERSCESEALERGNGGNKWYNNLKSKRNNELKPL